LKPFPEIYDRSPASPKSDCKDKIRDRVTK